VFLLKWGEQVRFCKIFIILALTQNYFLWGVNPPSQPSSEIDKVLTTEDMRALAQKQLVDADKELNRVYALLLSGLTEASHKKKLINAQNAWIKFRDMESDFEGFFYEGGTIQLQVTLDSKARITRERVAEFNKLLAEELNK
jgi:uncharacterized protein YecT (DUF1311 family)